jgi:hypothetical protein
MPLTQSSSIKSLRVIFPEACFAWRVATNHEIPRSLLRGGSFSNQLLMMEQRTILLRNLYLLLYVGNS